MAINARFEKGGVTHSAYLHLRLFLEVPVQVHNLRSRGATLASGTTWLLFQPTLQQPLASHREEVGSRHLPGYRLRETGGHMEVHWGACRRCRTCPPGIWHIVARNSSLDQDWSTIKAFEYGVHVEFIVQLPAKLLWRKLGIRGRLTNLFRQGPGAQPPAKNGPYIG